MQSSPNILSMLCCLKLDYKCVHNNVTGQVCIMLEKLVLCTMHFEEGFWVEVIGIHVVSLLPDVFELRLATLQSQQVVN